MRKVALIVLLFSIPFLVWAQNIIDEKNGKIFIPTSSIAANQEMVLSESDVAQRDQAFLRVHAMPNEALAQKIKNYYFQPGDLFSKDISRNTNLISNISADKGSIIFYMDLLPGESEVYLPGKPYEPMIDVSAVKLADFDLREGRLIINNEEIIDWSNIAQKLKGATGTFVGIATLANSYMNSDQSTYYIYPKYQSAVLKFTGELAGEEMNILNNLTNNNGLFELYDQQGNHLVKLQPNEVYGKTAIFAQNNHEVKLLGIDLLIHKNQASYRIRVEEPWRALWLFDMKVKSSYFIGAAENNIVSVDESRPWYSILGRMHGFRPIEVAENIIAIARQATSTPSE